MIHAIMGLAPHSSIYVISFLICTVARISHHELIHDSHNCFASEPHGTQD
jgi:hypothetical protein